MTALAKLPAKWRESARGGSQYSTTEYEDGCTAELRRCADELEAALSPAELGGVEGPLRVFSEGAWVYEETGQRFRARDLDEAAFAEYLRHPLSTPRAAEADWLPIESAPKDGTYILVSSAQAGGAWVAKWEPIYGSGYAPDNPWMPMMLNTWHLPNRHVSLKSPPTGVRFLPRHHQEPRSERNRA